MDTSNKETIGLAGEYAVAFELCRRGFYAQLTLGNHKKLIFWLKPLIAYSESQLKQKLAENGQK